ncbi:MAG: PepSY-associated TM helix domain-containing protein [Crinalium sp.]
MKFREIAFTLHQYLGLFLGIVLVIMGVTGSLLVFGHEIDHFLNPNLFKISPQGERVPIELVLNNIRSYYPDLKLQSITLPQQPTDVYELRMLSSNSSAVNVYADPYKGVVLGSRLEDEGLINFLFNLHVYLLAGDTGMTIVGIVGLLLILISITGVIVWSGWRRFSQGFSIKWSGNWRRLNFDIHKVAGIFSVAFLLLIASTGSAIAFYSFVEPTVYSLTRTSLPSPPTSQPSTGLKPLSVDQILQKANIVLPSAKTTFMSLPSSPVKPVKIRKKFVDEIHPTGENYIYIDQFSGKILRVENVLEAPLATRILGALYPLHIGRYGGVISRIIHIFVGIATTGLFFTGLVMWWHRQKLKARHKKIIKQNQTTFVQRDPDGYWMNEWPWF